MDEILRAENLTFGGFLEYPEIVVEKGKATFICGPSGCGKSTLLRLLNDTLAPGGGRRWFDGKEMEEWDAIELRRRVLLASQTGYLFPGTVMENFTQYCAICEKPLPERQELEQNLRLCDAPFALSDGCDTMSGGEKQRVFLAICLAMQPQVLMLDEPTSALDSATAHTVGGNLKQYCTEQGMTLVVISHDDALVEQFADRVIRLRGREA